MKLTILTNDGTYSVNITGSPAASGGQGLVYRIRNQRYGDCILKLYKSQEKADKIRDKILYMMRQTPPIGNRNIKICWPIGAAYDSITHAFRGFIMPIAFPGSRDLTILDSYSPQKTIAELFPDDKDWHNRFELKSEKGLKNRLIILNNWLIAIEAIHASGNYIMGDIKPENILVTADGKISVIDIDSCQISDRGRLRFECDAKTPNYFPAEAYDKIKRHEALDYRCDSFAIGCCIYSILVGCHPYTNIRLLSPFDNGKYNTISSRIRANLYHRGSNAQFLQRISFLDLHSNLDRLSPELIKLFDRCFIGYINRPSTSEWRTIIKSLIKKYG